LDLLEGSITPTSVAGVHEHFERCGVCRDVLVEMRLLHESGALSRAVATLLEPGSSIGRYKVLDIIGSGAMGTVYGAYDPVLDRRVALKLVRASGPATDEARKSVLREAQAMARLQHANVVAVHDAGTFNEHLFIAMERSRA
jgi:serine/threonine protein kinase